MTVWNEFFGGFQQNMRNDYVRRNLRKRDYNALFQEDALWQSAAAFPERAWLEGNEQNDAQHSLKFQHDEMSLKDQFDSECPGKQHSTVTYSDNSETREKDKQGVISLCF